MVFKRRTPRSYTQTVAETFYPRGGWSRASRYIAHRLRRLPDPAYKISRGVAAGVFICFTPFFGLHFFLSALTAWAIRGNVLAALLATFFGNPLTFPLIAALSIEFGSWMLGQPPVPISRVFSAFSDAAGEIWRNFVAIFTPARAEWASLAEFFQTIFLPYLVGGILPGLIAAVAAFFLTKPVITAYQKARAKRFIARQEKLLKRARANAAKKADAAREAE